MGKVLHEWDEKLLDLFKDMPQDPRRFISAMAPTGEEFLEIISGEIFTGRASRIFATAQQAFDAFADFVKPMLDSSKTLYWRRMPEMGVLLEYHGPCFDVARKTQPPESVNYRFVEYYGEKVWVPRECTCSSSNKKYCNEGWLDSPDKYQVYSRFLISDKPEIMEVPFEVKEDAS